MSRLIFNDDTVLRVLGDRLKQLREQQYGLSYKEMSKSAGINLDNYMRGERGQRNSSFGLICNIAWIRYRSF